MNNLKMKIAKWSKLKVILTSLWSPVVYLLSLLLLQIPDRYGFCLYLVVNLCLGLSVIIYARTIGISLYELSHRYARWLWENIFKMSDVNINNFIKKMDTEVAGGIFFGFGLHVFIAYLWGTGIITLALLIFFHNI